MLEHLRVDAELSPNLPGKFLGIFRFEHDDVSADLLFEVEADVPEIALLAPFIVPAQLLGFHTGIKKGFNPDEPKNLSRVVILE